MKKVEKFWILDSGSRVEAIFSRVKIPKNMVAIFLPRSTFNRLGSFKIPSALFDSGFKGNPSQSWFFPNGAIIHTDEAWGQLLFLESEDIEENELYSGKYQEKD